MKGYWVVAVQDVLKPDAWSQVLSAWENYVVESNGICKPISFAPPAAVYESGISKTTAVIEFPSLDEAVKARTKDASYFQGVIEADGTSVESKVIRDFRIIETEGGWMKPGHGYWLVWVREFIDKDNWVGKVCLLGRNMLLRVHAKFIILSRLIWHSKMAECFPLLFANLLLYRLQLMLEKVTNTTKTYLALLESQFMKWLREILELSKDNMVGPGGLEPPTNGL